MRTFGKTRKRSVDLNITSLIDVVFMLLIFFMIGSNFDKPALGVELPTARSGEAVERKTVEISIDADGRIFWEGMVLSPGELTEALKPLAAADREIVAALSCDERVPFGTAAAVMDAVKGAGIVHAALRHEYPR